MKFFSFDFETIAVFINAVTLLIKLLFLNLLCIFDISVSGPDCWHNHFPVATEGKRQSPVDIETSKIVDGSAVTSSKPLTWNYSKEHCLEVENTGASWKVNVNGTGSCKSPLEKKIIICQSGNLMAMIINDQNCH